MTMTEDEKKLQSNKEHVESKDVIYVAPSKGHRARLDIVMLENDIRALSIDLC